MDNNVILKFHYEFDEELITGDPETDTLKVEITDMIPELSVSNYSSFTLCDGYVYKAEQNPEKIGIYHKSAQRPGYVPQEYKDEVDDFTHGVNTPCFIYIYPYIGNDGEQSLKGEIRIIRTYQNNGDYPEKLYEYFYEFYSKDLSDKKDLYNENLKNNEEYIKSFDLSPVIMDLSDEYRLSDFDNFYYFRYEKLKKIEEKLSNKEYWETTRLLNMALCYMIYRIVDYNSEKYDERFKIWINMMDEGEESYPEKKSFEYLCIHYPNKKNELTKFRELKKRYFKIERTLSNYDNFNNISDDKILRKEYNQIRKELKRNGYRDNRMIRKSRLTTNIIVFILCAIMIFSCIIILPLLIFTIPILIKMIRK